MFRRIDHVGIAVEDLDRSIELWGQTMQMTPSQPGMESSQKMMLYMMPVVFGYVACRFPAVLSIYYVVTNPFTTGQTVFLLRRPIDGGASGSAPATQK